ncbi:hypothetical protein AB0M43_33570 [Longispora sp. NPDC051575]|uniref:hypothetical protein n=1 Tax=Longispora sp. NPDC051575 TaxID=3154943 RepID=UPI00341D1F56
MESQRVAAAYLASTGWPYATDTGAGRQGADILGTPGLLWEVKARRDLNLVGWLRQAVGHGVGLPLLLVRPDGMGPATVADWPAVLRLSDLVTLLRSAGYGDPITPEVTQ